MEHNIITITHSLATQITTMAMIYAPALLLMLIEHMERYLIGFGRTGSKCVGIGACLNSNTSLLGVQCTMTSSQLHTRLLFNCDGNDKRLRADVDVNLIWNGSVFVLNKQAVRWC